jgi:hypothetical protein
MAMAVQGGAPHRRVASSRSVATGCDSEVDGAYDTNAAATSALA